MSQFVNDRQYDVTVRVKETGYLAYQFRLFKEQLETHRLYKECVADPHYEVTMMPVIIEAKKRKGL